MHVAPANNSGKCMMNYDSEILCRDNWMRNCGPQPYLKIFQNIFQSSTNRWREKISHSAMPCTSVNDGKLASLHIHQYFISLGLCRKSDQGLYGRHIWQDPSFYTLTCFQPLNLWS